MGENGFLSMGGYAAFVWPAYLAAALVLLALALASLWRLRTVRRRLAALESGTVAPTGAPRGRAR